MGALDGGSGFRTLVVTDNSPSASAAVAFLTKICARLQVVTNARDAVRAVTDAPCAMVIFPEALGTAFCHSVRAARPGNAPLLLEVVHSEGPEVNEHLRSGYIDNYFVGYDDPRVGPTVTMIGRLSREITARETELTLTAEAMAAWGLRHFRTDLSDALHVTFASDVGHRPTRRSARELAGARFIEFLPEESAGKLRAEIRADMECARDTAVAPPGRITEIRMHGVDGEMGHRRLYSRVLVDDDGEPFALSAYSLDTTEAKRTENALRQSESDYRRLFEGAHDAIVIFDPTNEKVLDVNPKACEIYGRPRGTFVGLSLIDISLDPINGRRRVNDTVRTGSFTQFRTRQRRGDGRILHLDINASLIEYRGRPAIVSVNRDITDLVRAEEQLKAHKERLEHASALEVVGLVTSGVAHDFNNIMAIIVGCTSMLRIDGSYDLETEAVIQDIEEASERGTQLVRQLLDTFKGRTSPPRLVRVEDVVRGMERLLGYLTTNTISIELDLAEEGPSIIAAPTRIEQLLVNLVVNARDAIGEHGKIRIATEVVSLSGGQVVVLTVSDDGCGMTDETLARAHEPFFSTKGDRGTGMGLPVVVAIARELAGELTIRSELGKGTTMTVVLPEHASARLNHGTPVESSH